MISRVRLISAQGCDNYADVPILGPKFVKPARGKGKGLRGEYFAGTDFAGKPLLDQAELSLDVAAWFTSLPVVSCANTGDLTVSGGVLLLDSGTGACASVGPGLLAAIEQSGRIR